MLPELLFYQKQCKRPIQTQDCMPTYWDLVEVCSPNENQQRQGSMKVKKDTVIGKGGAQQSNADIFNIKKTENIKIKETQTNMS